MVMVGSRVGIQVDDEKEIAEDTEVWAEDYYICSGDKDATWKFPDYMYVIARKDDLQALSFGMKPCVCSWPNRLDKSVGLRTSTFLLYILDATVEHALYVVRLNCNEKEVGADFNDDIQRVGADELDMSCRLSTHPTWEAVAHHEIERV